MGVAVGTCHSSTVEKEEAGQRQEVGLAGQLVQPF